MDTPWGYSFGQWKAGPPPHGRPPVSSYSARSYSLSPAHKEFVDVLHRAELGPHWRERSQVWLYRLAIADATSPVGDLGKVFGALAVTTIPVPRVHYLARRIHLVGERLLAELFIELAAGGDLHGLLERYARLAPAADFIRALGGRSAPRAVSGGRR